MQISGSIKESELALSTEGIKATITKVVDYANGKIIQFSFNYENEKQIKAMNQKYAGEHIAGTKHVGSHIYDGILYHAYSNANDGLSVDTIELLGKFDLDKPLKRFSEIDKMIVTVKDFSFQNEYNEKIQKIAKAKIMELIKSQEKEI